MWQGNYAATHKKTSGRGPEVFNIKSNPADQSLVRMRSSTGAA